MKKLKTGDNFVIHCYKHNGIINKMWDKNTLIDIQEDYIVLGNRNVLVTKRDGRRWRTRETAIVFFYPNRWFNIIAQIKEKGIYYYCNITSPYIIDNNIIKYIDYDLDLRGFPNGDFRVLDRNEYNYHRRIMKYPHEINYIINNELRSLIEMYKNKVGPFNIRLIEYYKKLYKNF